MKHKTEPLKSLVIGAGPAGAVAAALLCRQGRQVLVVERDIFPRFSIGESLLPQAMVFLAEAGMIKRITEAGFQIKDGAAFVRREHYTEFNFSDQSSGGWNIAYQVPRARFDHLLALEAERQGAEIKYGHEVVAVDTAGDTPRVTVKDSHGAHREIAAAFVLDASGFGRVLPRLLQLELPSKFPSRGAIFTHVEDRIAPTAFDRNKIRITVHPERDDVWYWLIPFAEGRSSLGVVAETGFFARYRDTATDCLRQIVEEEPSLRALLAAARWDTAARQVTGYATNVKSLYGRGYALLGNAAEFLDPVFSSGVTIAVKSASLAAAVLQRQLSGEKVDWRNDYARPLERGVETFRAFVESWYSGGFQRVIFHRKPNREIRRRIAAILAGYAWDLSNPYVRDTKRRLATLEELCR